MKIQHHPSEDFIAAYAAGTLDQGQHIAMGTHLVHCPSCRALAVSTEYVGGETLTALPPAPMPAEAFARAVSKLDRPAHQPSDAAATGIEDVPGLPAFVRRLPADGWSWDEPGLHLRRLRLGRASSTRVFLLRSRPGARFLRHTHTGLEMTCVLTGSFSHGGALYAPGDFDLGTPDVTHDIEIGRDEPCISLVAMQGVLKLPGPLGRFLQPFITL